MTARPVSLAKVWTNHVDRRKNLEDLGKVLNYERWEDWYDLSHEDLKKNGLHKPAIG